MNHGIGQNQKIINPVLLLPNGRYRIAVNFDVLAQASDFRIERMQVVFLCWMQDSKLGNPRHQFASRLLTHKPTELSRIKQRLELNSPSLWWVSIQPTWLHCRLAFAPGSGDMHLISMLWHRQAIFESKGDKLSSSAECRIPSCCFLTGDTSMGILTIIINKIPLIPTHHFNRNTISYNSCWSPLADHDQQLLDQHHCGHHPALTTPQDSEMNRRRQKSHLTIGLALDTESKME